MNANRELVLAAIALQTPKGEKGLSKQASAAPDNFKLLKQAGAEMMKDPANQVLARLLLTKTASQLTTKQLLKAANKAKSMQKADALKIAVAILKLPKDQQEKAASQIPAAGVGLVKQAFAEIDKLANAHALDAKVTKVAHKIQGMTKQAAMSTLEQLKANSPNLFNAVSGKLAKAQDTRVKLANTLKSLRTVDEANAMLAIVKKARAIQAAKEKIINTK